MSKSFATPWTEACQVLLFVGFPRQKYWSGLPFPSLWDLSNSGTEPMSPVLAVDSLPLSHQGSHREGVKSESESHSVVLQPHGLYSPWNSPGQNTGVGSLSLLQEIFPTQGLNPGLPHCRHILYQLSQKGSPWILEWVVYPFSSGSSRPRNQTRVSCIAGRFWEGDTLQNLLTKGDFSYKYSLWKATSWFSGPFPCLLLFRK